MGYRINLSTTIAAKDLMTGNEILNETFSYSSTYKTQDEFFETKKKVEQKKDELKNLSNKFKELKSLIYEYRDKKEDEIKEN